MHSEDEIETIGKDASPYYDNVNDSVYYCIGALMTVIMLFGFFANFVIIYTFGTNKKIRTVDNTLIIGLALSDIGQSIFGLPFVVIASFSKKWIFGHSLCQYYAFVTTCLGISQIATLTVIAMERYFVIVKSDRRLTSTACRTVLVILFSFVYGSIWATGPLLGWSKYKQEDIGIACCVAWEVQDKLSLSYTMSICTFGWFIPLLRIAYGYISIACSIYKERNRNLQIRSQRVITRSNRERRVAITVIIMIGAFVVSWTPYSVVSLWTAVGDINKIPIWVIVAPAVFAKCSIIWNPIIYVARHDHFRKAVKQSMSYITGFRFEFRKKLSLTSNFYNTCLKPSAVSTNVPSIMCQVDEVDQKQYLLQNQMPKTCKMKIKGRSISFKSYFPTRRASGGQFRLQRLATVGNHVESSHQENYNTLDERTAILPRQQNDIFLEEYRTFIKDSDTQIKDNVFDDNCLPHTQSQLVQTETCLTDSCVPSVNKANKDTQSCFSGSVIERRLDNKCQIDSCMRHNSTRNISEEESNIHRNSIFKEDIPCDGKQNGHRFKLLSSVKCLYYSTSLQEDREIKENRLETLKLARNLMKRQLEMLHNAQCRSHQAYSQADNTYFRGKGYTRRRLLDNKNPRGVSQEQDLFTTNLPSISRKNNRSMKDLLYRGDDTSLCTFSKQVNNCELSPIDNTQIAELGYFRRNNRHYFSVDSNIAPSSVSHPFARQTIV